MFSKAALPGLSQQQADLIQGEQKEAVRIPSLIYWARYIWPCRSSPRGAQTAVAVLLMHILSKSHLQILMRPDMRFFCVKTARLIAGVLDVYNQRPLLCKATGS